MVLTASTMMPLGAVAPDFALRNIDGQMVQQSDFAAAAGLLVMFICNHCPYVKHIAQELAALGRKYIPLGIAVVGINANDAAKYPEDDFAHMREMALRLGYPFPYLYDETQAVAKAYHAACTPDFFLLNRERRLVYRGQLDSSRPGNTVPVTGQDLRLALDALLAGQPVSEEQRPSMGCNIKWKPGNAPGYFS